MPHVDIKVVLLGDSSVGKTCLSERISKDRFTTQSSSQNTIGTAFVSKQLQVEEKKLVLGIWDTAGFERYDSMTKFYYRGAQAAIVCYDVTNPKSFTKAKYWVREVRSEEEGCRIYICATKKDLLDEGAQASPDLELVENYAAAVQTRFYITSSKTGENVSELFQDIANYYAPTIQTLRSQDRSNNGFITLTSDNKKSSCCPSGRR